MAGRYPRLSAVQALVAEQSLDAGNVPVVVPTNPFATQHIRPGSVPYQLPAGVTWSSVYGQFAAQRYWGVIEGPHGVGKSTFLASFAAYLAEREIDVRTAAPANWKTDLRPRQTCGSGQRPVVVFVDSMERLHRWSRSRLGRHCRRRSWGLLATAHRSLSWPPLARLTPDVERLIGVVERLQRNVLPLVSANDVRWAFEQTGGNARETLLSLYDVYEQRQRTSLQPVHGLSGR